MIENEHMIGLSIGGGSVQAVALRGGTLGPVLFAVDDWEETFPPSPGENGGRFTENLARFLTSHDARTSTISVALDTSRLFIQTIPAEHGIPRERILERIGWELTQYHPGSDPKDFITDYFVVGKSGEDLVDDVLCVSVRRSDAQAMQKALAPINLQLGSLNADHFSAESTLLTNYPDIKRRQIAFASVKERRIDVSVMRDGALAAYWYSVVSSREEIAERVAAIPRDAPGIQSITAYGTYLDRDLLSRIREHSSVLVEALNPFRRVSVSETLEIADHLSVPSYRFAAAIGAALGTE